MSELFSKFWTWYQDKPAHVTVLSSGALLVDATRLLSSEGAKKQIAALENFPLTPSPQSPQPQVPQRRQGLGGDEQPQREVRPAE